MCTDKTRLNQFTESIIGCAFTVANKLRSGFLEKCYKNALAIELRKAGLSVSVEHPIPVLYDGIVVGEYFADLLVENSVIVELKAGKGFDEAQFAQCLHYLTTTGKPICLLINFGQRVDVKRFVGAGFGTADA
ncbi:MAG TPA: GxxExxY protein [Tepidisphaeraceae bacterium]|nr:GxxExxY protein [Tepidisphaeraceae bacterium]